MLLSQQNHAYEECRYNYPGVTNNLMLTIDSYVKLAQHPKIVGCKMYVKPSTSKSLMLTLGTPGLMAMSHTTSKYRFTRV